MEGRVATRWPASLPCGLALVGEAPGEWEVRAGEPFVGPSGRVLNWMLARVGLERDDVLITNVFDRQLPGNSLARVGVKLSEARQSLGEGNEEWARWVLTPVESGCYVPLELARPALERLRRELTSSGAKAVVPLGATAVWALCAVSPVSRMGKMRGTVLRSALLPEVWVVPTYHPASIFRGSDQNRLFIWADMQKALRVAREGWQEPVFDITVARTVGQVEVWLAINAPEGELLALDIETAKGRIDCIGLAARGGKALVVPFILPDTGEPWWAPAEEALLKALLGAVIENPRIPKVLQNGLYDIEWLHLKWGLRLQGYRHDTRLLHHALYPELPKDLATLASLYADLGPWKLLNKAAEGKRDA